MYQLFQQFNEIAKFDNNIKVERFVNSNKIAVLKNNKHGFVVDFDLTFVKVLNVKFVEFNSRNIIYNLEGDFIQRRFVNINQVVEYIMLYDLQ
jgi:hypothetical protein